MNRDKNTLVILIPGFPKDQADSTCLPAQQIFVRRMKELHPEINIVVLSFQYPYHTQPYRLFDVDVIPFSIRTKKAISKWVMRRKIWQTLKEINNNQRILGLLSFWCSECAAVGKRFADKNQLKHYCWLMGQDARKSNDYVTRINPDFAELIALSDSLQKEFEKNHGIQPFHIIPNGIDDRLFSKETVTRDIDLISAGSLIPLKQYDIFLRLIATAAKKQPQLKAVLIGDGPEKASLQQLANQLGIESNLTFTGEIAHGDTLRWMQRSKLLIHPSSYEGFSGVCLEALHAGCNVISFCRAMDASIDHWHIVADETEMKNKMLALLAEKNLSHQAITPFTVDDTVRKIVALYQ